MSIELPQSVFFIFTIWLLKNIRFSVCFTPAKSKCVFVNFTAFVNFLAQPLHILIKTAGQFGSFCAFCVAKLFRDFGGPVFGLEKKEKNTGLPLAKTRLIRISPIDKARKSLYSKNRSTPCGDLQENRKTALCCPVLRFYSFRRRIYYEKRIFRHH